MSYRRSIRKVGKKKSLLLQDNLNLFSLLFFFFIVNEMRSQFSSFIVSFPHLYFLFRAHSMVLGRYSSLVLGDLSVLEIELRTSACTVCASVSELSPH